MTTVKDGSSIIYNRSGTTIDTYVATGTNVVASTTNIIRSSSKTVVILEVTPTAYAVNLPSDAEIGDIVEVYLDTTNYNGCHIRTASGSGETFLNGVNQTAFGVGALFRKVSATKWGMIGQ